MSQLKVNAISDAAGANGNAIALATDGSCTVKATNNLSNRNLIINGAMNISQRATTSTANGYGSLDRWKISYGGADEAVTHAQHALTSSDTGPWAKGFRNSLHLTNGNQTGGADAGDYSQIAYRVEAQDLANSGWDYTSASAYITVSFWVKASVAQTYYCNLETSDGTAQLYSFSTGALSADTWTKITKTIPGNSNVAINDDNGIGLILIINQFLGTTYTTSGHTLNQWAAAGSYGDMAPDMTSTWWTTNDATFEITGVQLEVGETATEFEMRSYGDELRKCQRYYFRIHPTATSDVLTGCAWTPTQATAQGITFFPVVMRTRVTALEQSGTAADYQVSVGSGGADCSSVPTFQHGGVNCAATTFTVSGTPWNISNTTRPSNKTTDGFLAWSAEL